MNQERLFKVLLGPHVLLRNQLHGVWRCNPGCI